MEAGNIHYQVDIDTRELLRGERDANRALDNLDRDMQKVDRTSQRTSHSLSGLAKAIAAAISVQALRNMAEMVQQHQAMSERVRMATSSTEEYEMVQRRLLETANGTYRALSEAQEVYIRTADSLRSMGYETAQALDITDALSYSFVTNTTSADRAAAATSAFAKSMNTGKVSADQWETITSAIPTVINNIAEASGKSAAEIRSLGAQGKLSAVELSEGLRQARDEIQAAADAMSTDLVDAGVRSRNALVSVLVSLEEQTGALQGLTDGIIAASEAVLEFSNDTDGMVNFLTLATTAGAAMASIIAGRLLTGLTASTAALYANTLGARAKAAADLQAAQAAAALAAQTLIQAQAAEQAARGFSHHALMVRNLTVAEAQATAATTALTAAQQRMAGTTGVLTLAVNGLRGALTLLGGPAGILLMVASAFVIFGRNAKMASSDLQELIGSVETLGTRTLEYRKIELEKSLEAQSRAAARAANDMGSYQKQIDDGMRGQSRLKKQLAESGMEYEKATAAVQEHEAALKAIQDQLDKRASGADVGPPEPPEGWRPTGGTGTDKELTEFQKLEQAMQNQIALAKLSGAARAELSALQRLGSDATAEEVERIRQLSAELYNLEEAEKAAAQAVSDAKKANDEAARSYEDNEAVIQGMRDALNDAVLSEFELIEVQARRALNKDATAQQVAQVEALARATRQLKEEEKAREEAKKLREEATAADPRTAAADQYAQQLEAYKMYKEQELITDLQYLELKNAATTQYEQARLAAQEEIFRAQSAGNEFLMSSIDALGSASTEVMSGLLSGTMNTQEAFQTLGQAIFKEAIGALVQMGVQYVKNLIMGQAAAAAATATATGMATTLAAAWAAPAALASLASFGANSAPAMAGIASTIGMAQGLALMGGRMYGGPVQADGLYRVNEGGKPEIFNAANGMQYMMPNQRGQVVSHADATGAAAGPRRPPVINIYESPRATVDVTPRQGLDGEDVIDIVVRDIMNDGRTRDAIGAVTGSTYQGD